MISIISYNVNSLLAFFYFFIERTKAMVKNTEKKTKSFLMSPPHRCFHAYLTFQFIFYTTSFFIYFSP